MVSSVLMFQPIKHKFHLIFISRPKGRRSTSTVSHPAYAYISNKPMKYLDQILYYLVDISLEEYFVFLILDEKSILRRGYASQIGGFSKGTHFLYRVYGFKLSYFKMKTPTDFTIIISVIASLVMSLSITGRFE